MRIEPGLSERMFLILLDLLLLGGLIARAR